MNVQTAAQLPYPRIGLVVQRGGVCTKHFEALEECLGRLPAKTARVFMMREHLGSDTGEICKELSMTPTHCWVLLYRARMALQLCLNSNWFGKT